MKTLLVLFEGKYRYLVQRLRDLGFLLGVNVIFDESISMGESIWEGIQKLIKSADLIMVLMSRDFMSSAFYKKELVYALKHKSKLVIPIFIDIVPKELINKGIPWSHLATLAGIDINRIPVSRL